MDISVRALACLQQYKSVIYHNNRDTWVCGCVFHFPDHKSYKRPQLHSHIWFIQVRMLITITPVSGLLVLFVVQQYHQYEWFDGGTIFRVWPCFKLALCSELWLLASMWAALISEPAKKVNSAVSERRRTHSRVYTITSEQGISSACSIVHVYFVND